MKITVAIDSFKGSLSSLEAGNAVQEAIAKIDKSIKVTVRPLADGGEGTVAALSALPDAETVEIPVCGPLETPVKAKYCILRDTNTAVMEMAEAAGINLVPREQLNPMKTTTYGVGELIRHAVEQGCRDIVLGLGGSCTNDAGTGCAAALGVRFFDAAGAEFIPNGATLHRIADYDTTAAEELLRGCTLTAMCDIDNPMYGPQGAAAIFGPQKGADEAMVAQLDHGLRHLAAVIRHRTGWDVNEVPGAGAAGAFGAGVVAFLGGALKSGIETVLDCVRFDELLQETDMVFTGEGQLDSQSLRGKVVIGIARRAAAQQVPVVAVVGSIGEGAEGAYELGVTSVFSINRRAEDFSVSRHKTKENFSATMDAIVRLLAR